MFVATAGLKADIHNSGASSHMTFQKDVLSNYGKFETPELVGLGDGCILSTLGNRKVKVVSHFIHGRKL